MSSTSIPHALSAAPSSPSSISDKAWSIMWAFLIGLILTAIFFRSILPRLPRILFRGKLRIKRAGLRGIRGIEYRSKGFHNDSAAFSRNENQLEVKVQRIYASFHLPYCLCRTQDQPNVVPRKNGAIITIHVQGVGVRLPRSRQQQQANNATTAAPSTTSTAAANDQSPEFLTLEEQEELRLQQLMSSPPMSPSLANKRTFSSSFQSDTNSSTHRDHSPQSNPDQTQGSAICLTCHRAGLMSIHSVLGLANWFRCAVLPAFRSVVLRAFRAALFILTSSLPVLTSLVSIEVDRIEVYIQEAETVARIGRAGLTFSMSPDSASTSPVSCEASQGSADTASPPHAQAPTWTRFLEAMRTMPTRVGSGARDVATYLVAGMSPSTIAAHLRVDSIDLFQASFKPESIPKSSVDAASRRGRAEPSSGPSPTVTSPKRPDRDLLSPSQSDADLDLASSSYDDSIDYPSRPTHPKRARSNSASRLSKMPSGTLRGFADRWADWALEPLVESDFYADSGWSRQYVDAGVSPQQLQTIPAAARIASVSGLTELTATLLVGSNLALGGDRSLAARLKLGNIAVGLDAAHRVICIVEERKARRKGFAPTQNGLEDDRPSRLSKHLVQQRPSAFASALRVLSSASLSLPSIRVTASSDALLSSVPHCADTNTQEESSSPLPSREIGISLAGFNFELQDSDPRDDLHRRWLGTCGLSKKTPARKTGSKAGGKASKSATPEHHGSRTHGGKAVEHRRTFLAELNLASFDVRCGTPGRGRGSQLLFVGDVSAVARSSWTPFGLSAACPDVARLLLAGDPNEHASSIEVAVGGVESDVCVKDISAIIRIANEFSRRRQIQRSKVGIDQPPRPRTDIQRLRQIPKLAAGIHVERISLVLDASHQNMAEHAASQQQSQTNSTDTYGSRKLVLTVPNVDFVFFGEYRDEYVKRPAAEKRAAYKALKNDSLEWPLSGAVETAGAKNTKDSRHKAEQDHRVGGQTKKIDTESGPASLQTATKAADRYTESDLTIEEALKRMEELDQHRPPANEDAKPVTARRLSIRDTMLKTGKVRVPGYTRKSSMASETRFSLRYQFETSLRVDAVESFLSLSSDPQDSSRTFLRPQSSQTAPAPAIGSSQHHLLALHSFEVLGSGRVPGNAESRGSALCPGVPVLSAPDTVAEFRANIEDIDIEAWQISALDTYADIAAAILQAKELQSEQNGPSNADAGTSTDKTEATQHRAGTDNKAKPLVERLPGGLAVYLSIGRTIAHLGGPDRRLTDKMARGVGLEAERIVVEYAGVTETKTNVASQKTNWGARTALELSEDLQLQAQSLATRHGRVGLARIVLHEAGIFPILDAKLATKQHTDGTASETFAQAKAPQGEMWPKEDEVSDRPATSLLADSVWTFKKDDARVHQSKQQRPRFRQQDRGNFIFFTPYAACKAVVRPPQAENKAGLAGTSEDEVFLTTEDTKLVAFNIDLLHTYCFLLAFSTFKHLAARAKGGVRTEENNPSSAEAGSERSPMSKPRHPKPSISCRFDINEVHTFVTLPRSTRVFLRMRRLEVRQDPRSGLSVSSETVMGAVESPKHLTGNVWEEAVRLRDWRCTMPPKVTDQQRNIIVSGDAALIRIPFGYVVFPIIDNTTVAIKATKQLFYQFLHDKEDSIIAPVAEDPKLLPNIDLKVRVLTLEAEDDPFETKLNLIWRAGLAENNARDEREAAFFAKAEEIAASKRSQGSTSFHSSRSNDSLASTASSIRSFVVDDDDESITTSHDARSIRSKQEHVSYEQARIALDAFNSSSWVRRYLNAQSEQSRRQERLLKNIYGRFPMSRNLDELPVKVLPIGKAAPLFRSTMYRVALQAGQAHFPVDKLRDFIHEKGAGVPKDIDYSLIIPLHVKWEMEEWRVVLRDYPMPLLHVPPTHRAEHDTRKAWCFEGDIAIAEQLGGPESIRHVPAVIVPAATGRPDAVEYGIIIPKVAMSVKMYGTPTVRLRTPYPTRLVWGQSIQPTIQDVMRVIDGITPPPHDPSPKLGFWDKLPLILHGHVNMKFEDEGGFNIHMKGSRDPYSIEGHGAGWVKSWKGGVEIRIGYVNPEHEFFQILSHEFVLAVPDLCDYVDHAATGVLGGSDHASDQRQRSHDQDADGSYHDSYDRKSTTNASLTSSMYRYMKDPTFRKVVIKLTNGVRWGAGLHGERTCDDETCPRRPKCHGEPFYRECRNFERIHHWDVVPRTREYFDSIPEEERRDSFRGWRSHHLHLSISVYSPKNGIPGYGRRHEEVNSEAINNFYFSPLAWEHFWAWMRLFSSAMSLPIRAGSLFPDSPPPSPKFGRFLGTIKYRIDLSPLFITHQYRQFNKEEWARGYRTHVGVKARIDSFTLDMHQRQQETVKERPELGEPRIVFHKPFYEAEVKCDGIDLRTFAARLREESGIPEAADDQEVGGNTFDDLFAGDSVIPDDELAWIDLNDIVELDADTIRDDTPKVRLFPAMVCPQFNYYRKVDSKRERRAQETKRSGSQDSNELEDLLSRLERSKFGNEDSHVCMVGHNDKPYNVQRKLAQERLQVVRREIDRVLRASDSSGSGSETESEGSHDHQDRLNELHSRERLLSSFISHIGRIQEHMDRAERHREAGQPVPKMSTPIDRTFSLSAADLASLYHDLGTFDNRYVAHNPTLFFSNVTRTLLLKYYYSSRLRRGYAHHMTATAVRYIRDLLKKKDKCSRDTDSSRHRQHSHTRRTSQPVTPGAEGGDGLDILHEMLEDTVNHMFGKDGYSKSGWGCTPEDDRRSDGSDSEIRPNDGISDDFNVVKSNVCLLLKPQVVLRSDIDDQSTVIVTALRTRLQNYTVRDESCAEDSVNAIVLRRNFFALDNLQCFHPNARAQGKVKKHAFVSLPFEALIDLHGHGGDFERIVPHTSATVYYDKFNKLRLSDSSKSVSTFRKDGKPVQDHLHHHMDMILLNCPRFSVSANSGHFAALYNVVTDLILYRDPAHRDHAKRLEEMMFSYDFTDVSGLADIVTALQVRIREARSLTEQYHAVSHRLNERGKAEFLALLGETLELIEELNLIMDAITTSQDSKGGADREKKSALRFMTQAQEVAWNMIGDEAGQLVAKLALRGISFSWLNKADNSAANTLSIRDLQALNVDPNAMFAEIITKHTRHQDHPMAREGRFLDAMWSVLPPVGGISIVDMFEFNLHPVRIQIELLVGRKIMDYIFGSKRQRDKQEEEQKRIENEANRPANAVVKKKSPLARLLGGRKQNSSSAGGSSDSSRRVSMNESSRSLSATVASSRSASTSDVVSTGRASSDGSKEDDGDIVSDRTSTKAVASKNGKAKNSAKSRPGSPSSGKDGSAANHQPTDQFAIAQRNAAEMRSRASAYRTFVYVKISQTIFCLSYKGEKQKSITDLYDLVFRSPTFEYHNSTFGYVDLADNFKKDVLKAAWNQKSTLLRDIITHRPNRKRNAIESIRAIRQASRARDSLAPLDISVEPPTPTGRPSYDGSSHLAESPTDTFSFRDTGAYNEDDESGGHGDDGYEEDADTVETDSASRDSEEGDVRQHGHDRGRNATGQTLAGQIRDAWGRSNSSESRPSNEHSTDEVDDLKTPRREDGQPRRFTSLGRGFASPSTDSGTLHQTNSSSSFPFLHIPGTSPSGPVRRRGSTSSPSRATSPFKLNKLLPKSLRQRTAEEAMRRNSHSWGDTPQQENGQVVAAGRSRSSEFQAE